MSEYDFRSLIRNGICSFKLKLAKDSATVMSGNLLAAGLGFLSTIIISRSLGPDKFGLLSTAIAVMTVIISFSELGLGTSLVRFVSFYLDNDVKTASLISKTTLIVKLFVNIVIIITGWIYSPFLADRFLGNSAYHPIIKLVLLSTFFLSMSSYLNSLLQSHQMFTRFALWQPLNNIIKLAGIVIISFLGLLNVFNTLIVFLISAIISFMLGFIMIPRQFLKEKIYWEEVKKHLVELYKFSRWIYLSFILTSLTGKIDIFLLSYFKGTHDVGIYSAAYQLAFIFPLIYGSLNTVLLPKFSKFKSKKEITGFLKKIMPPMTVLALSITLAVFIAKPLIFLVFGTKYLSSIGVFQILTVNYAIGVMLMPLVLTFYPMGKVNLLTAISFILGLLLALFNWLLIPVYGIVGAALALLAVTLVSFPIYGYYVWAFLKEAEI